LPISPDSLERPADIVPWIRSAATEAEWHAIRSGATTIVRADRGAVHASWRRHRPVVLSTLRTNRPSTHFLLSQLLRPLHQYEINDLDVDGERGHLLVGLTNRLDTFFQIERFAARLDRPRELFRHGLAAVLSFLDGANRGPGARSARRMVHLDWSRLQ
jgi:hypothetical protein